MSVSRSTTTNPVLGTSGLARLFALASNPNHQDPMCLTQQANADRKSVGISNLISCIVKRVHVVDDFTDVVLTVTIISCFKCDNVLKRGLSSFDL